MFLDVDLEPNKHPSLRFGYGRVAGGSYLGFEEIEEEIPPPFVLVRKALDPLGKTAKSPTLLSKKLREEELAKSSGLLSGVVGELDQVFVEEGRTGDAPKTHPGGQNLGETVDPENAAIDVQGKEGRDERGRKLFEEILVRRVNVVGTVKLEEVVWVWKPGELKTYVGLEERNLPSSRMIKSYFWAMA